MAININNLQNTPIKQKIDQPAQVKQQANQDWSYCPNGRQGYVQQRGGVSQPGEQEKPLDLDQILGLHLWYDDPRRSPDVIDEQLSMFELDGGNDGLI